MFVTVVISHVRKAEADHFAELAIQHAKNCESNEPGCVSFQVVRDSTQHNAFAFVETYRDESAFQSHLESDHLKWWKQATANLFLDEPTVVRGLQVHSNSDRL